MRWECRWTRRSNGRSKTLGRTLSRLRSERGSNETELMKSLGCWLVPVPPVVACFAIGALGQAIPSEKGNDARIDRLLQQMTLAEKIDLIRGA